MLPDPSLTFRDLSVEARKRGLVEDARWDELVERVVHELISELVPPQRELLADSSTFTAAYCTRQCGKSYSVARDLIITALEGPGRQATYINATYGESRRIMWDDSMDGLPAVLRSHGLDESVGISFNISKMTIQFPNGSSIECLGADNDGFEKLRGNKRDLIVVDEAQKASGLREAMPVLTFCLAARRGRLVLIGTPNRMCRGYFHDVCTAVEPGWSVRRWSMADVTTRPDIWKQALLMKQQLRLADDDPDWMREGMGLWVRSEAGLILPVDSYEALHDGTTEWILDSAGTAIPRKQPLHYLAGVDLGFVNDPFALVVISYSLDEGIIREEWSEQHIGLGTDEQAARMNEMKKQFPGLNKFIIDDGGIAKQIADDFRRRHHINIISAQKHDRLYFIEELRTSLRLGKTLVRRNSSLHRDLQVLSWDEAKYERGELEPGSAEGPDGVRRAIDHQFDAFRYVWREAEAFIARRPDAPLSDEHRLKKEHQQLKAEKLNPKPKKPKRPW